MREIIVDTETTGLDPESGHRLVEIACVEIVNLVQTQSHFHAYINPERDVPKEAFRIHGLSTEFLRDKPLFSSVAAEFLTFIGESQLVIHNAEFDMKFINFELKRLAMPAISMNQVIDTLAIARKKHPNAANSLDALCARYRVNNSKRVKHGALLDAELLAEVYSELMGGRQTTMSLAQTVVKKATPVLARPKIVRIRDEVLSGRVSDADREAHAKVISGLKGPLWADYIQSAPPESK